MVVPSSSEGTPPAADPPDMIFLSLEILRSCFFLGPFVEKNVSIKTILNVFDATKRFVLRGFRESPVNNTKRFVV